VTPCVSAGCVQNYIKDQVVLTDVYRISKCCAAGRYKILVVLCLYAIIYIYMIRDSAGIFKGALADRLE
jgi:hypothetical protein